MDKNLANLRVFSLVLSCKNCSVVKYFEFYQKTIQDFDFFLSAFFFSLLKEYKSQIQNNKDFFIMQKS